MANSQTAILARNQVPARNALQEAIKSLRFKLTIDESYVPFESAGYIPCTLDGEDAGFEIKFSDNPEPQIGDRDTAIVFRWGGDPRERASALIVAATLAQGFGALVQRQDESAFRAADQLLDEARKAFAQLQEE